MLKYTIGFFWVPFLLSGISRYSWVFLGILDIISFFGSSEPNIKVFSNIALDHEKLKSGCSCDDNNIIDNKVYKVWNGEIYIKWGRGAVAYLFW